MSPFGSTIVRWILALIDLAAIGLPAWYYFETVSLIYAGMIFVIQPFIFRENSLYWRHGGVYRTYWNQLGQLIRSYWLIFILFCVYSFLTQALGAKPHADALLVLFAAVVGLNIAMRLVFTGACHISGLWRAERYVVIGTSPRATLIAEEIKSRPRALSFAGYVVGPIQDPESEVEGNAILGGIEALESLINEAAADHVVVVLDEIDIGALYEVIDRVAALPVVSFVYNEAFNVLRQRYKSGRIGPYTMTSIESLHGHELHGPAKRIMDFIGAAILIFFFSPVMAALALAVKLSSPGPVLYVSDRVCSPEGKTFRFYKFRSMHQTSSDDFALERAEGIARGMSGQVLDSEATKVTPKNAITPVGRFLRKSSLDELPQLFNVLNGDMSLVGPRPCVPYEFDSYAEWHKRRFRSKTGITGLWQVVGRSRTTFDEQVILDIYYIDHQTIWFDVEILLKTVPVVLTGRGGG